MVLKENKTEIARWFAFPQKNEHASMRFFCIPHGGGSITAFRGWHHLLPQQIELCLIQLPGRDSQFDRKPSLCLKTLAREIAVAIQPLIEKPYALFGHSMGALICYELAKCLRKNQLRLPEILFVSGFREPEKAQLLEKFSILPNDAFIEKMQHINEIPQALLKENEWMKLMIPVMKADFEMIETYIYQEDEPFDFPIHGLGGLQDNVVKIEEMEGWGKYTNADFQLTKFPGNHFFLYNVSLRDVTSVISKDLNTLILK